MVSVDRLTSPWSASASVGLSAHRPQATARKRAGSGLRGDRPGHREGGLGLETGQGHGRLLELSLTRHLDFGFVQTEP